MCLILFEHTGTVSALRHYCMYNALFSDRTHCVCLVADWIWPLFGSCFEQVITGRCRHYSSGSIANQPLWALLYFISLLLNLVRSWLGRAPQCASTWTIQFCCFFFCLEIHSLHAAPWTSHNTGVPPHLEAPCILMRRLVEGQCREYSISRMLALASCSAQTIKYESTERVTLLDLHESTEQNSPLGSHLRLLRLWAPYEYSYVRLCALMSHVRCRSNLCAELWRRRWRRAWRQCSTCPLCATGRPASAAASTTSKAVRSPLPSYASTLNPQPSHPTRLRCSNRSLLACNHGFW